MLVVLPLLTVAACAASTARLGDQLCPEDTLSKSIAPWRVSPLEPICIFYLRRHTINHTRVIAGAGIGYLFLLHQKFGGGISILQRSEGALASEFACGVPWALGAVFGV